MTALASLTASDSNPALGEPVTLTATANRSGSGAEGVVVDFYDGVVLLGTGSLDAAGTASLTVSSLATGSHTIRASLIGGQSQTVTVDV